jgi:hypothetical protein
VGIDLRDDDAVGSRSRRKRDFADDDKRLWNRPSLLLLLVGDDFQVRE